MRCYLSLCGRLTQSSTRCSITLHAGVFVSVFYVGFFYHIDRMVLISLFVDNVKLNSDPSFIDINAVKNDLFQIKLFCIKTASCW